MNTFSWTEIQIKYLSNKNSKIKEYTDKSSETN